LTISPISPVTATYREIASLLNRIGLKPIILETPYYSIKFWNSSRGHPNPSSFEESDIKLTNQIDTLNSYIEEINTESGVKSPKLNIDFRHSRTKRGKTKYYNNLKLLRDGIHPGKKLAKAWLKKIVFFASDNTTQNADEGRGRRR